MTPEDNILSLRVAVKADAKNAFADWQMDLHTELTFAPGFISLEILSPTSSSQSTWQLVQRFTDGASALRWHSSKGYSQLLERLKQMTFENEIEESFLKEKNISTGVTEVIITKVPIEKVESYRGWIAKIHRLEMQFPGFRGVYVQPPEKGREGNWITLLQFDTPEQLDSWLTSEKRQNLLNESYAFSGPIESHRVISPYSAWFASIAKEGEPPALWKQTMLVLLVLYPIVMMEMKYLNPWTSSWHISLAMFLGNAISVSLISWPMMPLAIKALGWWLQPSGTHIWRKTMLGAGLVLLLYALEILIFWALF
jgi:antibiotic biosynthesis monooxygenase (ABM) superfamily enzyme